jgi:hypothetical protein
MTERPSETGRLPIELRERMAKGASYEELLGLWNQLGEHVDLKAENPLSKELELVYRCLQKGACDSGVRNIFRQPTLLNELEALGIPREFLLQCVMVGALVDQLNLLKRGDFKTNRVEPQKLWLEVNGWDWANEELQKLGQAAQKREANEAEEKTMRERVKKEAVVAELQANLKNNDFRMSPEQKKLLRDDFRTKLIRWKAFCDRHLGDKEIEDFRLSPRGSEPITPEVFAEFSAICKRNPKIKLENFPLEIINPDSGWFYVLVRNNVNSINKFLQGAVSNMNNWFEL